MGLLKRRSGASSDQKVEKEITILNRLGLHARPAAMFVRVAARYRAEIWVSKEGEGWIKKVSRSTVRASWA